MELELVAISLQLVLASPLAAPPIWPVRECLAGAVSSGCGSGAVASRNRLLSGTRPASGPVPGGTSARNGFSTGTEDKGGMRDDDEERGRE